jgi:hypothetical protein
VIAGNAGVQCSGTTNGTGNVSFPDGSCGGSNADPKLGAFAGNGGSTKTLVPGPGSPALDTISSGGDCPGADQRGASRPQGAGCDSGAVEAANPALSANPGAFGNVRQGQTAATTITVQDSFDPLHPQASLTGADAADFALSSDGCSSTAVASGGTCVVQVTFTAPAAVGERSATLHIAHDAAGPPLDVPLSATVIDVTPPVLSGVALAHKAFAVAKRKPPPRGTTIRFVLSEPASVNFSVSQKLPGRRKGKRCVAPTRKRRHAKHCTRTVTIGSFSDSEPAGPAKVPFSGRVGGHALKPGRYTLTLAATDLAGNHGSPHSIAFTIVRRSKAARRAGGWRPST